MVRLGEALIADRDRWALWLPVGLGTGIALYFALPWEPPWSAGLVVLVLAVVAGRLGAGAARGWPAAVLALALGSVALGFAAAQLRTAWVAAPMLAERSPPVSVTGRVERVENMGSSLRVTLDTVHVGGLADDRQPERVRVRLRGEQPALTAGDRIRLRAVLMPPPAPSAPGAFDFQRRSYFERLGGVGFGLGPATVEAEGGAGGWRLAVNALRQRIDARISRQLDGEEGAVAQALMTGERGAIPDGVMDSIRGAGLAHLLAISGLHIGLVAGVLFAAVRMGLALVPPVALRLPAKKVAAVVAILGAAGYAVLAGATVPSQRAFLMIGLVLLAVLVDRRGLSMRLVAWAAAAILLLAPESLLSASFQLSFAAVTALIAFYEAVRLPDTSGLEPPAWPRRMALYIAGVALTTLVAGAATAPYAVFHFNRFAEYGVVANVLAVPVTALWVMPWAVAAFLLMPLGLEGLALVPMGWGITLVIGVADWVASWPGAVAAVPAPPLWGLVTLTLGGLWLCLWRRPMRFLGLGGIAAGLVAIATASPPDVLIDGEAKLLAVRTEGGQLAVSSRRTARFARETWTRRNGAEDEVELWPASGPSDDGRLACDSFGCLYRTGGYVIALARTPQAVAEDCHVADIVVSTVPVRRPCPAAIAVVDRFDLWRFGAHALWLDENGVRIESVASRRGDRPWAVKRPDKRTGG